MRTPAHTGIDPDLQAALASFANKSTQLLDKDKEKPLSFEIGKRKV